MDDEANDLYNEEEDIGPLVVKSIKLYLFTFSSTHWISYLSFINGYILICGKYALGSDRCRLGECRSVILLVVWHGSVPCWLISLDFDLMIILISVLILLSLRLTLFLGSSFPIILILMKLFIWKALFSLYSCYLRLLYRWKLHYVRELQSIINRRKLCRSQVQMVDLILWLVLKIRLTLNWGLCWVYRRLISFHIPCPLDLHAMFEGRIRCGQLRLLVLVLVLSLHACQLFTHQLPFNLGLLVLLRLIIFIFIIVVVEVKGLLFVHF